MAHSGFMSPKPVTSSETTERAIKAFDNLNGSQPGFRPAHAKGILLTGTFTPSAAAHSLTRAPHIERSSTPVSVRFSDFAGIPNVPDNNRNASPRGMAIRFHLAEHKHTDIIAHSVDGFPARTAEEFAELLEAIYASGAATTKPLPIEQFLGTHPAALKFEQTPKPFPTSFATESYFGVSAYRFTNNAGVSQYGRYRIRPNGPVEYLDDASAAKQSPNYLIEDIQARIGNCVKMRIFVQLAAEGDVVDDATVSWPHGRPEVEFGTVELSAVAPQNQDEQRHIIFDPIPRVDGIEPSGDPLLEARAQIYLATGRRRRVQGAEA
jgi:catalase